MSGSSLDIPDKVQWCAQGVAAVSLCNDVPVLHAVSDIARKTNKTLAFICLGHLTTSRPQQGAMRESVMTEGAASIREFPLKPNTFDRFDGLCGL